MNIDFLNQSIEIDKKKLWLLLISFPIEIEYNRRIKSTDIDYIDWFPVSISID